MQLALNYLRQRRWLPRIQLSPGRWRPELGYASPRARDLVALSWIAFLLFYGPISVALGPWARFGVLGPIAVSAWNLGTGAGMLAGGLVALLVFLLDGIFLGAPVTSEAWIEALPQLAVMALTGAAIGTAVTAHRHAVRERGERRWADEQIRRERRFVHALLEGVQAAILTLDEQGHVRDINTEAHQLTGYDYYDLYDRDWVDLLVPQEQRAEARSVFGDPASRGNRAAQAELHVQCRDGGLRLFAWRSTVVRDDYGRVVVVLLIGQDVTEARAAERVREELVGALREALANVKTLSGLLPICSSCKKIRSDSGYWQQVEHYIQEHSDARFTHGLCPDCLKALYPDFYGADHDAEGRSLAEHIA